VGFRRVYVPLAVLQLPGFFAVLPLAFLGFADSSVHDLDPLRVIAAAANFAFYFALTFAIQWWRTKAKNHSARSTH
jgi:hypothetical protein